MNCQSRPVRTTKRNSVALAILTLAIASSARAASEGGLELLPDLKILTGLLVCFLLLALPLNTYLFKPILKALDEREARITGTRAKAERLSKDAQAVLERYETAIRLAREEAESARRDRLDEARARMLETTATARQAAEGELDRARTALAATLEGARASLRGHADELAREAAARVLGRAL